MIKVMGLFTCFNRLEKTKACIESMERDNDIEWHYVAADDSSTDGTKEFLEKNDRVEWIDCGGDAYYSGGMRAAIGRAKELLRQDRSCDYVLLFNDDVRFYKDAVGRLIRLLETTPKPDRTLIAGATEDSCGNYSYGGIRRKSRYWPRFTHVISEGELVSCDTFNGNCILIPKEAFLDLDNIDPAYRHSLGDYDYGFAAVQKGYTIYASDFYVGVCEHDHYKQDTWEDRTLPRKKRVQLKERTLGHPWRPWFHFLRKNYGLVTAVVCTVHDYMKILF